MAIAEPFCKTYKPSVREDGSCYWDEEPNERQFCNAAEVDEEERIIFWDSLFKPVNKNASVVTEFNLVTSHLDICLLSISRNPTLPRCASVTGFALCGSVSLGEAPSWALS